MQHSKFAVKNKAYCLWGHNLRDSNLEFIGGIDSNYFRYVAEVHSANLAGEKRQSAALAIRLNYFHSLESFFSLLMAALQGPDSVAGWLHQYQTKRLHELVIAIGKGAEFKTKFDFPNGFSWLEISKLVHHSVLETEMFNEKNIQSFASIWSKFAKEFTDTQINNEYNSIKHGFRVCPGGMKVSLRVEGKQETNPIIIGDSIYGSSFFVPEGLIKDTTTHFRLRKHSVNWDPHSLVKRAEVLADSMNNVISFLKMVNGVPPENTFYSIPDDAEKLEDCWGKESGLIKFSVNAKITKDDITHISDDEIIASYNVKNKRSES